MQKILEKLYQGDHLNQAQYEKLLLGIMTKKLSSVQIAAVLISMKIRGETIEEIIEAARIILKHAKPFPKPDILFADITGTGGDGKNTINISTASAIVASTCNIKIIKHGNNSISSMIGSTDILTQFNNKHTKNQEYYNLKQFNELNICFLCASQYHTIFKHVMNIRKQLKIPTLFNIIGPLVNPARPTLALIGVYKKELLSLIINALKSLNYHHAIVVYCDGIDEVGLHAPTNVLELYNGVISDYIVTPSDFGLDLYPIHELYCDSKKNAYTYMINLLKGIGKKSHISTVAANVALLLKLFGYKDLRFNTKLALDKIYQGIPYTKLVDLARLSTNL